MKTYSLTVLRYSVLLICSLLVQSIAGAQEGDSIRYFNEKQYVFVNEHWAEFYQGQLFLIAGGITVKFDESVSSQTIRDLENELDLTFLGSDRGGYVKYATSPHNDIFTTAEAILGSSSTTYVNIDAAVYQIIDDNNGSSLPCDNYDLSHNEAWTITRGSPDIRIAVIDAGFGVNLPDLGYGSTSSLGTYSNIWENPEEEAWTDINDPTTGDGVDSEPVPDNYVDNWKGWSFFGDGTPNTHGNNNIFPDPTFQYNHGTAVTSVIAAKKNQQNGQSYRITGLAGGDAQAATNKEGVKIIPIKICEQVGVDTNGLMEQCNHSKIAEAIYYAVDKGARIINMSFRTTEVNDIKVALNYAAAHNVLCVSAAGNDQSTVVFPANYPGVLAISGYSHNGPSYPYTLWWKSNKGPEIFLGARGDRVCVLNAPGDPEPVGNYSGTSFAAPFISGTAGLMLSANPCLSRTQLIEIMKATALKMGEDGFGNPLDYGADNRTDEFGYGFANVDESVQIASFMHHAGYDLYIKDCPVDYGITDENDLVQLDAYCPEGSDKSPDIWVRNTDDGFTEFEHQDPEYTANQDVYAYVRVRNKGCYATSGLEVVNLYWSKAASYTSWPLNWNGSIPALGNLVGSQMIPGGLQPGEEIILEFPWDLTDVHANEGWKACLLARIESSYDPITEYPAYEPDLIKKNNNVAIHNLTIVDQFPGKPHPVYNGVEYPYGGFMYLSNPDSVAHTFNFTFSTPDNPEIRNITSEAEVTVRFDSVAWNIFQHLGSLNQNGITMVNRNKSIILTEPSVTIDSITLAPLTFLPIYVGFSFLSREITENQEYSFEVSQAFTAEPERQLGTENYLVRKYDRDPFEARAGADRSIMLNQSTTLAAEQLTELATYNWYDKNDSLVYTGTSFSVSPEVSEKYTLEVIASLDGFKDYDDVEVKVRKGSLATLYPNPATSAVSFTYALENVTSAYVMIVQPYSTVTNNHILDIEDTTESIDMTNYSPGTYNFILVCDGAVADVKSIVKQ